MRQLWSIGKLRRKYQSLPQTKHIDSHIVGIVFSMKTERCNYHEGNNELRALCNNLMEYAQRLKELQISHRDLRQDLHPPKVAVQE